MPGASVIGALRLKSKRLSEPTDGQILPDRFHDQARSQSFSLLGSFWQNFRYFGFGLSVVISEFAISSLLRSLFDARRRLVN